MTGSAATLPQLFAVEATNGLIPGVAAAVMRAAYDPAEAPASPDVELQRYYALCLTATTWSEAALRRAPLRDYATFLAQGRGWGRDGLVAPLETLRTAHLVLGEEPFSSAADQARIQAVRKTVLEALHALEIAGRVVDARAERATLRAGTGAAARAFVAAQPFLGVPADEARAAVLAMRDVAAAANA